ncbi:sensor histidine kinase [Streptomyces sp. NPDC059816]|uniref:sensor histidine kinase n=1 Tax=Streptomyces sp. NPDC059816 TaxID=3346960 RepID=UPI00364CCC70
MPHLIRAVAGPGLCALTASTAVAGVSVAAPGMLAPTAAWALAVGLNSAGFLVSWRRAVAVRAPDPGSVLRRVLRTAEEGRRELAAAADRIRSGHVVPVPLPWPIPGGTGAEAEAVRVLTAYRNEIGAVLTAAVSGQQSAAVASGQQVGLLVLIARRQQQLVQRALDQIDVIERDVEDPDELLRIHRLDNLVTMLRRFTENLGTLGGASPRQIRTPVEVQAVLRMAIAETAHFARAQVRAFPAGTVPGYASVEITHLLAELVENAAAYSPPETKVDISAGRAEDGALAVLIRDRALALSDAKLDRINHLLSHGDPDITAQLGSGQMGLVVVARIAHRRRITVRLDRTPHGHEATVVLPPDLFTPASHDETPTPAPTPAPGTGAARARAYIAGPSGSGAAFGPRPSPAAAPSGRAATPGRQALPVRSPRARAAPAPAAGGPGPAGGRGLPDMARSAALTKILHDRPSTSPGPANTPGADL